MALIELSQQERDILGEIANISMGNSATVLSALLGNRKVDITTPKIDIISRSESLDDYENTCLLVHINYSKGLDGSNILLLKEADAKSITDMMMGGDGSNNMGELNEMHISAVSEAMNQMMGSASTSLSMILNRDIDITPPKTDYINVESIKIFERLFANPDKDMVKITFKLNIGDIIDSYMVQLYPVTFAKEMVSYFMG